MQYKIIVDKQPSSNPSNEKKEYIVETEELRIKGNVYDSINITPDRTYVTRRLSLSEYGVLNELETPREENFDDLNINLFEGENYIYVYNMQNNKICAMYIIKNDFTDDFATKNEMSSAIKQSAQNIELNVNQTLTSYATKTEMNSAIQLSAEEINIEVSKKVGKNEIISSINQSAEEIKINASKINLSGYVTITNLQTAGQTTINGSNITTGTIDATKVNVTNLNADNIKSGTITGRSISGGTITGTKITNGNNFNVDTSGNMTCNNATMSNVKINSGSVTLYDDDNTSGLRIYTNGNTSKFAYYASNRFAIRDSNTGYEVWASMGYSSTGSVIGASLTVNGSRGETTIMDGIINCVSLVQTSKVSEKKNFKKLDNALDIIKEIDIYKYNLKFEKDTDKKHIGFVIGKGYKYSENVTNQNNTGVDIYSLASLGIEGIKELENRLNKLEKILEVNDE